MAVQGQASAGVMGYTKEVCSRTGKSRDDGVSGEVCSKTGENRGDGVPRGTSHAGAGTLGTSVQGQAGAGMMGYPRGRLFEDRQEQEQG